MSHHSTSKRNLETSKDELVYLLNKGVNLVSGLDPDFEYETKKLSVLKDRLMDERFHLAVLGQFKRGKSTLLNALISEPILPVSVIPLTAVPTFIHFGTVPTIRVKYNEKQRVEEFTGASTSDRTAFLVKYVTEGGNPKNRLGVTEVEVVSPAPDPFQRGRIDRYAGHRIDIPSQHSGHFEFFAAMRCRTISHFG